MCWCSLPKIIEISPCLTKLQLVKVGMFFEAQCSGMKKTAALQLRPLVSRQALDQIRRSQKSPTFCSKSQEVCQVMRSSWRLPIASQTDRSWCSVVLSVISCGHSWSTPGLRRAPCNHQINCHVALQVAQLSQRGRAALHVVDNFAKSLGVIRNYTVEWGVCVSSN